MYTERQFEKLEQEERVIFEDYAMIAALLLATTKGNLEHELRDFYQKYGKDGVLTYAESQKWVANRNHTKRLTLLTLFVATEFKSTLSNIKLKFEDMLKLVILKEAGFFNVKLEDEYIKKLLKTSWGVDKLTWSKRLEDDITTWSAYVNLDIKRSILQGKSINDILEKLDKRFTTFDSNLYTLGLTETTAVGSLARQRIMKQLGVEKYQFFTKADERTCETCGSLHGTIFPISAFEVGVTASPVHPRCRCWEVPILE